MIHDMASFLRWRLKPNRWAVKGLNLIGELPHRWASGAVKTSLSPTSELMFREGYAKLTRTFSVPDFDLARYRGRAKGQAFVDIKSEHMDLVTRTFTDLLGDDDAAQLVLDYFEGRPWLWNVSLNYSDPMQGATDSQLWHFDYGDTRQLHFLLYFSDVTADSGPFTFLPTAYSDRVTRHPLVIERMTDDDLKRRFGIDTGAAAMQLCGKRGDVFANDPGRLMHQGARCVQPRLVLFVTFTSRAPMSRGGDKTITRAERKAFGEALRRAQPNNILPNVTFE